MLDKVHSLISVVYDNKQKAVAGFVVASIGSYLLQYGIDIETLTVKEALELVAYGVAGYIGVYIAPKNK